MSLNTIQTLINRLVNQLRGVTSVPIPAQPGASSASLVPGQGGAIVQNPIQPGSATSDGQLQVNQTIADLFACVADGLNTVTITSIQGLRAALLAEGDATLVIEEPLTIEGDEFLGLCIEGMKTVVQNAPITVVFPTASVKNSVFIAKPGSIIDWYQGAAFAITGVKDDIALFEIAAGVADAKPVINWIMNGDVGTATLSSTFGSVSGQPSTWLAKTDSSSLETALLTVRGTSPDGTERKVITGFRGIARNSDDTLIRISGVDHIDMELWQGWVYAAEACNFQFYERSSDDFAGETVEFNAVDMSKSNVGTDGDGIIWQNADKGNASPYVRVVRNSYRNNFDWANNVSNLTDDASTIELFGFGDPAAAGNAKVETNAIDFTNPEGTGPMTMFAFQVNLYGELIDSAWTCESAHPFVNTMTMEATVQDTVISGFAGNFGDTTSNIIRTDFIALVDRFLGMTGCNLFENVIQLAAGQVIPVIFGFSVTATKKIKGLTYDWNGNTPSAPVTELGVTAPEIWDVTSKEGGHNTNLDAGLGVKVNINGVFICGPGAVTIAAPSDGYVANITTHGAAASDDITFSGNSADLMYSSVAVLPSGAGTFTPNGATDIS